MKKKPLNLVIAIDGPAGAGKSTVSRLLAQELKGTLLDTGAMYRAVAYYGLKDGARTEKEFGRIARRLKFGLRARDYKLLVQGKDLGLKLRTEKVGQMASAVSRYPSVRSVLTAHQRSIGKRWGKKLPIVVEGRDIGTVVFPDVEFKFFVTADPRVRAKRRYLELKRRGAKAISLGAILRENQKRDKQDSTRRIAPLKCAKDAVVVDTSSMEIHQVVKFMAGHIRLQASYSSS